MMGFSTKCYYCRLWNFKLVGVIYSHAQSGTGTYSKDPCTILAYIHKPVSDWLETLLHNRCKRIFPLDINEIERNNL